MDRRQQILQTRSTVDGWVIRARSPEAPQPGAELEADDVVWPARRVSETARLALIASSEHLQLACQVTDGRRGYATALHTVVRGALLGAATAVWVVGPDDAQERQQRALRLAAEWYRRIGQHGEISRRHCPPQDLTALDDQIQYSRAQHDRVRILWKSTPTITAQEAPKDTKVIDWVAEFLFPADASKATSIRRQWAELSGDAHALGWQLVSRRTSPMTRERGGFRVTATEGTIEQIAEPYLAAFHVLKRGWGLFDRRCTGP